MHTNAENFVKIVQTSRPRGANLSEKFQILTVLGPYSHISAPINVKFSTKEWAATRAKFHIYRGNVSPLCGDKTHFCYH